MVSMLDNLKAEIVGFVAPEKHDPSYIKRDGEPGWLNDENIQRCERELQRLRLVRLEQIQNSRPKSVPNPNPNPRLSNPSLSLTLTQLTLTLPASMEASRQG